MYPPCDNDSCETTNSVIPAALRLFQGCTICVDTLHYLCRMCAERPLLKGIFYSWNILFCRIHLFCDLNILFKADFPIRFVVMPWCRKKQHTACSGFAVCCLCEVPYLLTKWHWTQLCMSCIWVMLRLMYIPSLPFPASRILLLKNPAFVSPWCHKIRLPYCREKAFVATLCRTAEYTVNPFPASAGSKGITH